MAIYILCIRARRDDAVRSHVGVPRWDEAKLCGGAVDKMKEDLALREG
jgi:hypothetical protein